MSDFSVTDLCKKHVDKMRDILASVDSNRTSRTSPFNTKKHMLLQVNAFLTRLIDLCQELFEEGHNGRQAVYGYILNAVNGFKESYSDKDKFRRFIKHYAGEAFDFWLERTEIGARLAKNGAGGLVGAILHKTLQFLVSMLRRIVLSMSWRLVRSELAYADRRIVPHKNKDGVTCKMRKDQFLDNVLGHVNHQCNKKISNVQAAFSRHSLGPEFFNWWCKPTPNQAKICEGSDQGSINGGVKEVNVDDIAAHFERAWSVVGDEWIADVKQSMSKKTLCQGSCFQCELYSFITTIIPPELVARYAMWMSVSETMRINLENSMKGKDASCNFEDDFFQRYTPGHGNKGLEGLPHYEKLFNWIIVNVGEDLKQQTCNKHSGSRKLFDMFDYANIGHNLGAKGSLHIPYFAHVVASHIYDKWRNFYPYYQHSRQGCECTEGHK